MRQSFVIALFSAAALFSGCATKKYVQQHVQQQVDPVQGKLNQVSDEANKTAADLQQTNQNVAKNTQAISATDEKATAADRRAGDAGNRADRAQQKADSDDQEIAQLRGVIANIDDYKVSNQATVLFKFNSATLSKEDQQQLDQLASNTGSLKRYFVAIEGYTDQTGPASYNLELSKRRADSVVQYLVGTRNVPFYQVRVIGLGDQHPVDTGKTRDARAKNRRVEVKIFTAPDTAVAGARAGAR
jgi:outer membrane protein OmpA-like peptidoglycan-associated protein